MKRTLLAKLAMVALLAFGTISQAQEEAAPPAADDATSELLVSDSQASVSDNVVVEGEVELAPAAAPATTSDCIGCTGTAAPAFQSSDCVGCASAVTPVVASPCATGCGDCVGCGCQSGCGTVSTAAYVPVETSCSSCSGVAQVAYQQPIYQSVQTPATPVSATIVNPAPAPVVTPVVSTPLQTPCAGCSATATTTLPAPVVQSTGCASCGTSVAAAPVATYSTACDDCSPRRVRVLRGRILGRR